MINGAPDSCPDFILPWVQHGVPTVQRVCESYPADQVERVAVEAIVKLSLENLRTFPWIAEREAAGQLTLSGLHFGIADGVLRALEGPGRSQSLD